MIPENLVYIPGYENLYSINEKSEIWSHRYGKCLKPTPINNGYLMVKLYRDFLTCDWGVHRLMALTFLGLKIVPKESGKSDGQHVDHIDRNTKNNHISNLRLCTRSQNRAWGKKQKTRSNLRGVYPKSSGRFQVMIRVNDKLRSIGYFSDPIEGAKAYDAEALKAFGEFANLNFPVNTG